MTTHGEVYDPIITAAMKQDPSGHMLLVNAAINFRLERPDLAPDLDAAKSIVRGNLRFYVGHCSKDAQDAVFSFYSL